MDVPPPPRDDRSFRDFYRSRHAKMIGLVRILAGRTIGDHEAVAQDGWRKFYPHWKMCDYPDAYLRTCMRSASNDALAKVVNEPYVDSLGQLSDSAVASARPVAPYRSFNPQCDPELAAALDQLSPRLREIAVLHADLEPGERSVQQIAEILGIKRVTAHMRLKRAHAKLRELLPSEDYLERRKLRRQGPGLEGSARS